MNKVDTADFDISELELVPVSDDDSKRKFKDAYGGFHIDRSNTADEDSVKEGISKRSGLQRFTC